MKRGTIIVLSGPSGAGKSTLVGEVQKVLPDLNFSISCTTRKPRGAEQHGVEYYFLSEEEFVKRINAGEFVEHAQVHANRYGTLKSEVLERSRRGEDVILDIEEISCRLLDTLSMHYSENLKARYKITDEELALPVYDLFESIGKRRGFRLSGGDIDTERTAKMLLDEFRRGILGKISLEWPKGEDNA